MRSISWKLWVAVLLCSGAVALVGHPSWAAHDLDLFELDQNALDDALVLGDDWELLNPPSNSDGTAPNFITRSFEAEGIGVTIFTTGGSKDDNTVQNTGSGNNGYKHKSGSVPDKDEILNAYAAAYSDNIGDLIIYFGADRFANDGDAQLGFWFFQENVGPAPGGTFVGEKTDGDILVLANFTGGGQVIGIEVFRWVLGGGPGGGGPDNLVFLGAFGDCTAAAMGDFACATSNTQDEPAPWPYTPKQGVAGTFPVASFFEGGINLTQLLIAGGITDIPCFTSFLAETRSSSSVDAVLKDFVAGSFDICGIDVTKACVPDGDGVSDDFQSFEYLLSGLATSSFGTLFDAEIIEDVNLNGMIDAGEPVIATLDTVAPSPGTAWGPFQLTTTINGPSDQVIARAATSPGGERTVVSEASNLATCPIIQKNPNISVDKVCRTCLTVADNMVKVTVQAAGQVCNEGDVPLTNVTVTDDAGTADTADDIVVAIGTLGIAECQPYQTGPYFPPTVNSPDPSFAMFSDTVVAEGSTGLFGDVMTDPVEATCPLCPEGGDDSGITCNPLP